MFHFLSLRRFAGVLAVLAVLGLVSALPAARTVAFSANGIIVSQVSHGTQSEGTVSGSATPGGAFTGAFRQRVAGNQVEGTLTLVFARGSLSLAYQGRFNPQTGGGFLGTFVFTGGTGPFAGATGGGTLTGTPGTPTTFSLSGALTL
jgi:hypothetical protein